MLETTKEQEVAYQLVLATCEVQDAMSAVRLMSQTVCAEEKIIMTGGTPKTWGWVEKECMEVEAKVIGRNQAKGRFAHVFFGIMQRTDSGDKIGEGRKVVFKSFLSNPSSLSSSVQPISLPFANEIGMLRYLAKRKNCENFGKMESILKTRNDVLLIVQPYYELGNLETVMLTRHHIDGRVAGSIIEQLWAIGGALRGHNVFHRDIRPSNICVTKEKKKFVLKLIDWKTSWRQGGKDMVGGKMYLLREDGVYQAPEVLLDEKQALTPTHRHDDWSLTLIMEQILNMRSCIFDGVNFPKHFSTLPQRFVWMMGVPPNDATVSNAVREALTTVRPAKVKERKYLKTWLREKVGSREKKVDGDLVRAVRSLCNKMFLWNPVMRPKIKPGKKLVKKKKKRGPITGDEEEKEEPRKKRKKKKRRRG